MQLADFKKAKLPDAPGVYFFKSGRQILYIGKATSLKDRVKSYFSPDLIAARGPAILDMVFQADRIDFEKTDSVIEALLLENALIKKHQPKYNVKEKDDRSYNYVIITKEDFPRVLIERGKNLTREAELPYKIKQKFGPFTNATQLYDAVKIVRKIFPFRDTCMPGQAKACFNYQIGLCPGVCIGAVSKAEYGKIIRNISLFFAGKKKNILVALAKDMKLLAKQHEFEKADAVKKTIFALNHIQDIALLKADFSGGAAKNTFRIEAYDVAHISGTNTVGVMTVVEDGAPNKNEYRKFKINNSIQNDVAALSEMLERRLHHAEWRMPNLIVVDGALPQKHAAEKILRTVKLAIDVAAVTKDERHRPKTLQGRGELIEKYKKEILLANAEAHRFAVAYHRAKRQILT